MLLPDSQIRQTSVTEWPRQYALYSCSKPAVAYIQCDFCFDFFFSFSLVLVLQYFFVLVLVLPTTN